MHSIDVDLSNFERIVLEGSRQVPVIVDFWAPWCAPCRALKPVLEKLAGEYQGRFTLAKINSDENQELAAQYGVRGIPNVKAFVDGELVDEFSGALPEAAVREFIGRVVPSPAEELRLQAGALYRQTRDAAPALELLAQAAALDAQNEVIRIDRAEILCDSGKAGEARQLLETLSPLAQMDDRVAALRARIEFAASASAAPDPGELERRIAQSENDLDARLQLARLRVAREDYAAALDQLLEIIRRDRSFRDDAARKTMLQVFSLLGARQDQSELLSRYRRLLASALN
ncbi:MAG TPA: tetratricopeptide repeat protein [Burkholderiales bacterium]|nr:tetratricopeptide repeat protein [Burkholderiales bacterium]